MLCPKGMIFKDRETKRPQVRQDGVSLLSGPLAHQAWERLGWYTGKDGTRYAEYEECGCQCLTLPLLFVDDDAGSNDTCELNL
jgi:hypothetical protein